MTHLAPFGRSEGVYITKSNHFLGKLNPRVIKEKVLESILTIAVLTPNYFNDCETEIQLFKSDTNKPNLLPIIISPCRISGTIFEELNCFNLEDYPSIDHLLVDVLNEISLKVKRERSSISNLNLEYEYVRAGYPFEYPEDHTPKQLITPENIIGKLSNDDKFLEIKGKSMEPKYHEGEIIHCRKITNDIITHNKLLKVDALAKLIKFDKSYIVESKSKGLVLKKVVLNESGETVNLISINPEYPLETIEISEIMSVWKIVKVIQVRYED